MVFGSLSTSFGVSYRSIHQQQHTPSSSPTATTTASGQQDQHNHHRTTSSSSGTNNNIMNHHHTHPQASHRPPQQPQQQHSHAYHHHHHQTTAAATIVSSSSSPPSSGVSSSTSSGHYFYAEEAARMLSNEEINKLLEKNQQVRLFNNHHPSPHGLIKRVDTNMYAANDPIEDRYAQVIDNEESFFAVYDGHAGDGCAEFLKTHLISYLKFRLYRRQSLRKHVDMNGGCIGGRKFANLKEMEQMMTDEDWNLAIHNAPNDKERMLLLDMRSVVKYNYGIPMVMKEACIYTDSVFCKKALVRMIKEKQVLPYDLSGACAILTYIQKNQLWVANTGDCRAIMARRDLQSGRLQAVPLSRDQTAETEEHRLRNEFPMEKDIVLDGRIKGGLQPSRSFGDIMYKEPVIGILLPDLIKNQQTWNPPYVKAEPEIQHMEVNVRTDEFIVIASDGLWDVLRNEDVVELVDQFCKTHHIHHPQYDNHNGQRLAEKNNVSTFLVRQALLKSGFGRTEQEKLSNLMQLPTEFKRMLHDDITVTVVFFNKGYNPSTSMMMMTQQPLTSTTTTTSTTTAGFHEIETRGEIQISPIYANVLKEFSELISHEKE